MWRALSSQRRVLDCLRISYSRLTNPNPFLKVYSWLGEFNEYYVPTLHDLTALRLKENQGFITEFFPCLKFESQIWLDCGNNLEKARLNVETIEEGSFRIKV
jgi:hypothetical protein